jgi:nodulation protein E
MKRVAITGAGTINALGHDVPATLAAMREGRCGIGPLEIRDVERLSIRIGGQVRDWDPQTQFNRQEIALYDRFTQFTMLAARQAVEQSGLDFRGKLGLECGVVLGTAGGGVNTWDDNYRTVYEEGKNRVHPFVVPKLMNNAAASHVSMEWSLRGPSFTVATACASSNHAMGLAFQMVRAGAAKAMITGGSEAMLCFGGIKAWEGLRVMSKDACRPFSANRNGMVQGEGAGVFVFEEWEHARARGARIYAEMLGVGYSADASHITQPEKDGLGAAKAMRKALINAGLNPEDIDYINAHGTSTPLGDQAETAAVKSVFGDHARKVAISSTKSQLGHLLGASGGVELVITVLAVQRGVIPPTINYQTPDPACDLDYTPNEARPRNIRCAMSNSFGFGGHNASLIVGRLNGL